MPTARNRSFSAQSTISGSRWHVIFGSSVRSRTLGPYGTCSDTIGNRPNPNAFSVVRNHTSSPVLDGEFRNSSGLVLKYSTLPIQYQITPPDTSAVYTASLSNSTLAQYYTQLLAKTNPNVAGVNIPQNIAELGDLPSLVKSTKQLWSDIFRLAALGYLSWRWIVRPLLSDLAALEEFGYRVNDRLDELLTVKENGYLRKRVRLSDRSQKTGPTNTLVESQDLTLYAKRFELYREQVWGSCQWVLAPGVKLPKKLDDLRRFSELMEIGLTTHNALRTFWELIPWSWFVDWFVGIGDFINAYDGTIPMNSKNACIMRTVTGLRQFGPIYNLPSWCSSSGEFYSRQDRKQRYLADGLIPLPEVRIPFLDANKHAILGSLAIVNDPSLLGHDRLVADRITRFLKDESAIKLEPRHLRDLSRRRQAARSTGASRDSLLYWRNRARQKGRLTDVADEALLRMGKTPGYRTNTPRGR